jgi:hypothetical protein
MPLTWLLASVPTAAAVGIQFVMEQDRIGLDNKKALLDGRAYIMKLKRWLQGEDGTQA